MSVADFPTIDSPEQLEQVPLRALLMHGDVAYMRIEGGLQQVSLGPTEVTVSYPMRVVFLPG